MAQCTYDDMFSRGLAEMYAGNGYPTATGTAISNQLMPCPKKKTMSIKIIAKKAFSSDLRTLIKAGVLNDDLSVANREFVLQFIVNKYMKELATEAKEHLKEVKEEENE